MKLRQVFICVSYKRRILAACWYSFFFYGESLQWPEAVKSKCIVKMIKKHHKTNTCIQYTISSEAIWRLRWKYIVLSTKNLKSAIGIWLKNTQYYNPFSSICFFTWQSLVVMCFHCMVRIEQSVDVLQNFSFWVSLKFKSYTLWGNVREWIYVQTISLNVS